jgi:hypothetical protein
VDGSWGLSLGASSLFAGLISIENLGTAGTWVVNISEICGAKTEASNLLSSLIHRVLPH